MIKSEYQILSRKIDESRKTTDRVQASIDILSGDLTVDRQDIDELKRKQDEIGSSQKTIMDKLNRIEVDQKQQIQDSIHAAIEKEVRPLQKTLNEFINSKKKIIVIREKFNLIAFIMKGFRGAKDEFIREIQEEGVNK